MREIHEVEPAPKTSKEILRHGLDEIASLAPGLHLTDPCYGARRDIKDYARRLLDAAEAASP